MRHGTGCARQAGNRHRTRVADSGGLSLVEMLVAIAILGMIATGLRYVIVAAVESGSALSDEQDLLSEAQHALRRAAMFARDTDRIDSPASTSVTDVLRVSERVLDTYDNTRHTYLAAGDGFLDADNDADGLVNEDATTPDPPEWITLYMDRTNATGWRLMEQGPDYGTADPADTGTARVVAEHVALFACRLLAHDLVEIRVVVTNADKRVDLLTRVRAPGVPDP